MLDKKGYMGIGPEAGIFVSESQAYQYALERSLFGTEEEQREFLEMIMEWFYSGNWIETE